MSLDAATQALWDKYLACEQRGIREERAAALERFVAAAKELPPEITDDFAYDLAKRNVDGHEDLPLRMPLFLEIVFPALQRGIAAGRGDCARWLTGLYQLVLKSPNWQDKTTAIGGERDLLKLAIERDSSDQESRRRLIEHDANYLRFTLHELPSGVLYGMGGATPEQCLELNELVDEFERLTEVAGVAADYDELIERCRLHFRAYREYLLNRTDVNYASFLVRMGLVQ